MTIIQQIGGFKKRIYYNVNRRQRNRLDVNNFDIGNYFELVKFNAVLWVWIQGTRYRQPLISMTWYRSAYVQDYSISWLNNGLHSVLLCIFNNCFENCSIYWVWIYNERGRNTVPIYKAIISWIIIGHFCKILPWLKLQLVDNLAR